MQLASFCTAPTARRRLGGRAATPDHTPRGQRRRGVRIVPAQQSEGDRALQARIFRQHALQQSVHGCALLRHVAGQGEEDAQPERVVSAGHGWTIAEAATIRRRVGWRDGLASRAIG
jgi:hypothetical protein